MPHPAKKIRIGEYEYRGYNIENMEQWDSDCKFWNVTAPNEDEAHDSMNTLRQAKDWIDFWIDGRQGG